MSLWQLQLVLNLIWNWRPAQRCVRTPLHFLDRDLDPVAHGLPTADSGPTKKTGSPVHLYSRVVLPSPIMQQPIVTMERCVLPTHGSWCVHVGLQYPTMQSTPTSTIVIYIRQKSKSQQQMGLLMCILASAALGALHHVTSTTCPHLWFNAFRWGLFVITSKKSNRSSQKLISSRTVA